MQKSLGIYASNSTRSWLLLIIFEMIKCKKPPQHWAGFNINKFTLINTRRYFYEKTSWYSYKYNSMVRKETLKFFAASVSLHSWRNLFYFRLPNLLLLWQSGERNESCPANWADKRRTGRVDETCSLQTHQCETCAESTYRQLGEFSALSQQQKVWKAEIK